MSSSRSYRDADTLQELYDEEGLSTHQMADELGVSQSTIRYWMEKHDIERDKPTNQRPPHYGVGTTGYVQVSNRYEGEQYSILLHRLLAVAEYGFEAVKGKQVHHKKPIPWLNYPDNIELYTQSEHLNEHDFSSDRRGEDNWASKLTRDQVEEMRDEYDRGGTTYRELADDYGLSPGTVGEIIREEIWVDQ